MSNDPAAPHTVTLLSIDDDARSLQLVEAALRQPALRILSAADPARGLDLARTERPQIVLLDLMMPGIDGIECLRRIVALDPAIDVILITGHYSTESAVAAIQQGACDYLNKPIDVDRLRERIGILIGEWRKRWRAKRLDRELMETHHFQGMIGRSAPMLDVFARLRRIGSHFQTALISGQTGTGKELVAHALHKLSPAAAGPFVAANCAAIPTELVESELFGHLKGSFTGAIQDKAGLFEAAHGGMLFLDELGELSPSAQAKLLRAIQHQEIQRIGATTSRKVHVRIVAASNRDLHECARQKTFREDLLFRLAMVEIHLPPLAERRDDLPLLMRHFVDEYAARYQKPIEGFTRRAEAVMQRYHWPGNVRDLENAIGYACMMAESGRIDVTDLPEKVQQAAPVLNGDAEMATLEEMDRRYVRRVLASTGGNKLRAAEILGISRATLYRLLAGSTPSSEDPSSVGA